MTSPDQMSDADLRAELLERLRGSASHKWKRIDHDGRTIRNATFTADGTACADGEPERVALEAMAGAHRRLAERRSKSAKLAAVTREQRKELEVRKVVRAWMRNGELPPAPNCRICGRALGDDDSLGRGVGSECWQQILRMVEAAKAEATL